MGQGTFRKLLESAAVSRPQHDADQVQKCAEIAAFLLPHALLQNTISALPHRSQTHLRGAGLAEIHRFPISRRAYLARCTGPWKVVERLRRHRRCSTGGSSWWGAAAGVGNAPAVERTLLPDTGEQQLAQGLSSSEGCRFLDRIAGLHDVPDRFQRQPQHHLPLLGIAELPSAIAGLVADFTSIPSIMSAPPWPIARSFAGRSVI